MRGAIRLGVDTDELVRRFHELQQDGYTTPRMHP